MTHRSWKTTLTAIALTVAGCGGEPSGASVFELPQAEAAEYPTAYLAQVVPDPPGDDLTPNAGEYAVIRNIADIRIDMGGWWIDTGSERLPLGVGRQIDVGAELRVHPGPGDSDGRAVFGDLGQEAIDDHRGTLVLRDAARSEVARLEYDARTTG